MNLLQELGKRTFRWLEQCESTERIHVVTSVEKMKKMRSTWQAAGADNWNHDHAMEWQQCGHNGIELSWLWTIGDDEDMVTGWQEVYWHRTALRDWPLVIDHSPVQLGHVEELTEWIRTIAHITFQSGSGSLHSSHTFLMLPCKAHGWSIGRLQQLPFHFSAICIEYSNSFI